MAGNCFEAVHFFPSLFLSFCPLHSSPVWLHATLNTSLIRHGSCYGCIFGFACTTNEPSQRVNSKEESPSTQSTNHPLRVSSVITIHCFCCFKEEEENTNNHSNKNRGPSWVEWLHVVQSFPILHKRHNLFISSSTIFPLKPIISFNHLQMVGSGLAGHCASQLLISLETPPHG